MQKHVTLLLVCVLPILASNLEATFGTYKSKQPGTPITFTLGVDGISAFKALWKKYIKGTVSYDYFGQFGNSEILDIKFDTTDGDRCIVKLFLVIDGNRDKLAVGYFGRSSITEKNVRNVRALVPLDFSFSR